MADDNKGAVARATQELTEALNREYTSTKTISRDGDKINIPSYMSLTEASKAILEFQKQQDEQVDTLKEFDCHPNDGLVCFYRAVREVFGELLPSSMETFFGNLPGTQLNIKLHGGQSISVPIGLAEVPGLPIKMDLKFKLNPNHPRGGQFGVVFSHARKFEPLIERIYQITQDKLKNESIFRGHAIDSRFEFIDLSTFNPAKVVFASDVMKKIEANILAPIRYTSRWRKSGSPLKRGILLGGPYGTGKTLTARLTAFECEKQGWTFINVRPGDNIINSLNVAKHYAPSVVFFEDIDQSASGERTEDLNVILNNVDGIVSKGEEVMVVVTTNHIEKINRAMLRPGRLDSVILLSSLDTPAIISIIENVATDKGGQSLIEGTLDHDAIGKIAEGYTAAFVAESVTKAIAYAIARASSDDLKITSEDIVSALSELRPQYEMMNTPATDLPASLERELGRVMDRALAGEYS